jgi:hypothetical protein
MSDYIRELRSLVGTRPLILVGAVVIIQNENQQILLQHRKDGDWGLPGGLMEPGESLRYSNEGSVRGNWLENKAYNNVRSIFWSGSLSKIKKWR